MKMKTRIGMDYLSELNEQELKEVRDWAQTAEVNIRACAFDSGHHLDYIRDADKFLKLAAAINELLQSK
jgi:hypothetical protein